jgi:hypothetical protein
MSSKLPLIGISLIIGLIIGVAIGHLDKPNSSVFFKKVVGVSTPPNAVFLRSEITVSGAWWLSFRMPISSLPHFLAKGNYREDTFGVGSGLSRGEIFDIHSMAPPKWWRPSFVRNHYTVYEHLECNIEDDTGTTRYLILSPKSDVVYSVYFDDY